MEERGEKGSQRGKLAGRERARPQYWTQYTGNWTGEQNCVMLPLPSNRCRGDIKVQHFASTGFLGVYSANSNMQLNAKLCPIFSPPMKCALIYSESDGYYSSNQNSSGKEGQLQQQDRDTQCDWLTSHWQGMLRPRRKKCPARREARGTERDRRKRETEQRKECGGPELTRRKGRESVLSATCHQETKYATMCHWEWRCLVQHCIQSWP